AREIQRRPHPDEPGGDETLQIVRHQPSGRLSADGDSNPDLLRAFQNARSGCGIEKREIPLGERSFTARYGWASAAARLADQHHPALYGRNTDLVDADDAKDRR